MQIPLPQIAGDQLVAFVLVLARVGGIFAFAPVFSSRQIPLRVRVVVASALALVLTPIATQGRQVPAQAVDIAILLVKETVVGLAFALAVGVVAAAVQAAAGLLDTLVGFAYAQLVDPMTSIHTGPLAQLYSVLAAAVFLLAGGDHLLVLGLSRSYDVLPLDSTPGPAALGALAADELAQVSLAGLEIAAPVVIALVLADVALALIARAVPQMNVLFVGLSGKILIGLLVAAVSLPFVARYVADGVEPALLRALAALGG